MKRRLIRLAPLLAALASAALALPCAAALDALTGETQTIGN